MPQALKWVIGLGLPCMLILGCAALVLFLLFLSYAPSGADQFSCALGAAAACSRLQTAYTVHNIELVLSIVCAVASAAALLIAGIASLALLIP